uniref:Uncharacterized protein n=1 Tax=Glossina pallidipes TaxID=7398 RepID=A0A1A9ZPK0_GLOPL
MKKLLNKLKVKGNRLVLTRTCKMQLQSFTQQTSAGFKIKPKIAITAFSHHLTNRFTILKILGSNQLVPLGNYSIFPSSYESIHYSKNTGLQSIGSTRHYRRSRGR